MYEFNKEEIERDEKANYELLSTKSREEWINIYLKDVRPRFAKRLFWKYRDPEKHHYDLPVDGTRTTYENRAGINLPAILYRPKGADGEKLPTYFQIHGGGWVMGSCEVNNAECCRYRDEAGVQVINIGYRLAPEAEFPAPVQDCYDGINYFVRRADQYGIDLERLGVGGDSAGGSLAIAMSFLSNDYKEFKFKMQLLTFPNVNLGYVSHDVTIGGKDPGKTVQTFYVTSPACYSEPAQLRNPLISALFASDVTLSKLPTTVLLLADKDQLRPQAEDWAKRCAGNGVTVVSKTIENTRHGFIYYDVDDPNSEWKDELCKPGVDFLVDGLKNYLVK